VPHYGARSLYDPNSTFRRHTERGPARRGLEHRNKSQHPNSVTDRVSRLRGALVDTKRALLPGLGASLKRRSHSADVDDRARQECLAIFMPRPVFLIRVGRCASASRSMRSVQSRPLTLQEATRQVRDRHDLAGASPRARDGEVDVALAAADHKCITTLIPRGMPEQRVAADCRAGTDSADRCVVRTRCAQAYRQSRGIKEVP
jgi:hypothetical protein